MPTKILITGANGLLARKIFRQFQESPLRESEFLLTGRGPARALHWAENAHYQPCELQNPHELAQLLKSFQPHILVHCAALSQADYCQNHPQEAWALNHGASLQLADWARAQGAYFLFLSTDFVFDGKAGPYQEANAVNPLNRYGATKAATEAYLQQNLPTAGIARTILVYGIEEGLSRSNLVLWVRKSLLADKAIQVVSDQYRSPTYAEDLARGVVAMAEKKAPGIFHIGGPEFISPYELALKVAEWQNLDASLISPATASTFREAAKRPLRTGLKIDKARAQLNYRPLSLEVGVRQMLEALPSL